MAFQDFLPLFVFAAVSTGTPGAATTLATVSGAHFGFRRSVPAMAGSVTTLGFMAAAAGAGLAGLLLAQPSLHTAMKVIGSIYLLWLAWKIGRSGPPHLSTNLARPVSFLGGISLLVFNPKGWAMTLGAAASFATLANGPARLAVLLGLTFGMTAGASLCLWCVMGQLLARVLRNPRQWRTLNMALGLLLATSILQMWR